MTDYRTFLAANVLNESKSVSYRLLSRELKVTGNVAKRMLFQFHSAQNTRKPGTLHAIYLVEGFRRPEDSTLYQDNHQHGDDIAMGSSPFMSSPVPPEGEPYAKEPVKGVTLCREEHLKEVVSRYQAVASVHIYSLSPASLKNLEVLSDCNRAVSSQFKNEDPLSSWNKYGVIQNPAVKRRTGPRPVNVVYDQAVQTPGQHSGQTTTRSANVSEPPKGKPSSQLGRPTGTGKISEDNRAGDQPSTKKPGARHDRPDVFKAFTKTVSKSTSQEAVSSANHLEQRGPTSVDNDEHMKSASEDEQHEDLALTAKSGPTHGTSRSEREQALRQMMEDNEDDDMADAASEAASIPSPQEPENGKQKMSGVIEQPPATQATTGNGRRRGRRKVMKKKTIKDEEGYLVTKEEPAWESFSEEDLPPNMQKDANAPDMITKTKKGSGKPGQGNITSFFGKR